MSIKILRVTVLTSVFPLVAGLAMSLPVALMPHQMRSTTMRNDMVDHGRCREPSMCFAPHTQRMLPQVRLAEPLPLAAVATLGGRRSVWVQGLVFVAVRTLGQSRTAGMLARFQCLPRHRRHLLRA